MRLMKMFGLAAVAAVAAMAFVGASSASAEFDTALCTENVLVCPSGKVYQGHIEAKSSNTELLTDIINVNCSSSVALANVLGLATAPQALQIHLESLNFTNCTGSGGVGCTATVNSVGLLLLLKKAPNLGLLEAHGTSATVTCGLLLSCKFGGLPKLHAEGGEHAFLSAEGATLAREGGLVCPEEAFWDAEYEVTLPLNIYISQ